MSSSVHRVILHCFALRTEWGLHSRKRGSEMCGSCRALILLLHSPYPICDALILAFFAALSLAASCLFSCAFPGGRFLCAGNCASVMQTVGCRFDSCGDSEEDDAAAEVEEGTTSLPVTDVQLSTQRAS
jgi:hypothetical protein